MVRFILTVDVDEGQVDPEQATKMTPEEWLRQEFMWCADSGIYLVSCEKVKKEDVDGTPLTSRDE